MAKKLDIQVVWSSSLKEWTPAQAAKWRKFIEEASKNGKTFIISARDLAGHNDAGDTPADRRVPAKVQIVQAPGSTIRAWAEMLLSPKSYHRIFAGSIADMQHEWQLAHQKGDLRMARWVIIRGYLSLISTLLALIPASVLRWLWEVWKKTKLG